MVTPIRFALTPDFSHLEFSDTAAIKDVLVHVLKARQRGDPGKRLLHKIRAQSQATTVGHLRQLTDRDWAGLDVPAMCRIFLKHAIRQSKRIGPRSTQALEKSFLQRLMDDFNDGKPFVMKEFAPNIKKLVTMGFNKEEAMEALVITDNKGITGALEVLFVGDPELRAERRSEALLKLRSKQKTGRTASEDTSREESKSVAVMRRDLVKERQRRQRLELDLKQQRQKLNLNGYKEFLHGILTDESMNIEEFEALRVYQREHGISSVDHQKSLKALGITPKKFEEMKNFEEMGSQECVICLEKKKDHVVMNCMHLCVCEECADDFRKPKSKCPICTKPVVNIVRIYTS